MIEREPSRPHQRDGIVVLAAVVHDLADGPILIHLREADVHVVVPWSGIAIDHLDHYPALLNALVLVPERPTAHRLHHLLEAGDSGIELFEVLLWAVGPQGLGGRPYVAIGRNNRKRSGVEGRRLSLNSVRHWIPLPLNLF